MTNATNTHMPYRQDHTTKTSEPEVPNKHYKHYKIPGRPATAQRNLDVMSWSLMLKQGANLSGPIPPVSVQHFVVQHLCAKGSAERA